MIKAEVVLASSAKHNPPIYTLKLQYPWFIHGEVMTHRDFSRNTSSNRAIPLHKTLTEAVKNESRAEPVLWGAEQKGMNPGEEIDEVIEAKQIWQSAACHAAIYAKKLSDLGVHKSICNRLLMPFTHAKVIITSTRWANFFSLRCHVDADPTMRELAEAVHEAIHNCEPQKLEIGEWHLPFVDGETITDIGRMHTNQDVATSNMIKVSVARCARVSYESFETGKRSTVEEDLKLYERLIKANPMHASPAEHQAKPDTMSIQDVDCASPETTVDWDHPELHGNLHGWIQYRKTLPNEYVK